MHRNPFEVLEMDIEEDIPTNHGQNRPTTPIGQASAPPATPGKKKAKRKADSLIPAISPIKIMLSKPSPRLVGKSATAYLGLARKALYAAIEAEKKEKDEQYIVDNDIQLLTDELEVILAKRPKEAEQEDIEGLSSLEIRGQLDQLNARLDVLATEIKEQRQTQSRQKEQTPMPIPQSTPPPQPTQPKTFAEALKKPITQSLSQETVPKPSTFRERRLILQGNTEIGQKIDAMKTRNLINIAFKEKAQIATPVIGTVAKSQKGGSIILTTTEKFNAEFLRKNESIWKPLLNFNRAVKDTTWSKVVLHGIPTEIFNKEEGMQLLE
jgi:DNA primase